MLAHDEQTTPDVARTSQGHPGNVPMTPMQDKFSIRHTHIYIYIYQYTHELNAAPPPPTSSLPLWYHLIYNRQHDFHKEFEVNLSMNKYKSKNIKTIVKHKCRFCVYCYSFC